MNELAGKWLAALRSGKYKKTKNALHKKGAYCILGVACDVAIKNGVKVNVSEMYDPEFKTNITTYDGEDAQLPVSVQKALGLRSQNGSGGDLSLIGLNDHTTISLKELADVIEFAEPLLFYED